MPSFWEAAGANLLREGVGRRNFDPLRTLASEVITPSMRSGMDALQLNRPFRDPCRQRSGIKGQAIADELELSCCRFRGHRI
jgi:hypothetical protein